MDVHLNSPHIHCNGYRQIFFENLLWNQRFGVEIVYLTTISTIYNHYKPVTDDNMYTQPISGYIEKE